jgi:protein TonB
MVDWKPVLPDVPLPQVTFAESSTAISLPPPTAVPQAASPPVQSADTDAPPIIDAQSVGYVVPPVPRYPPASRRAREEGEVLVRVLIGIDGRPNEVRILRSSGHARLDDAAIEAVRAALFRPYVADGRARAAYVRVPVEFALRPS